MLFRSSCHIYKAYDRPDTIETSGIYRDPVSATDTLAATDTANMGNLPWKEVFRDPKLQALIEEGLANNVDMQAAILRVIIIAVILSCMFKWLPVLNKVSSGFVIIICAVIASAAGALLYPIDDDAEEKD